jgi:hypothetical protein
MAKTQQQFPIFIPTLGRSDTRMTMKALDRMGVEQWFAVVEPQEYDAYAEHIDPKHLLVLDLAYKQKYRTLDGFGTTKSVGSGAARNFIWDTAIKMGHPWHWIMDDNIRQFCRYNNNIYHEVLSPVFFRIMEDFCLRYENVAMAGPNYCMFVARKKHYNPIIMNTRIYSCNLIRNDVPFRWRGRYNEDTILSLDMLTAGWCTVQFNTFLQEKQPTQTMKGGNMIEIYKHGTKDKTMMLVREFPQYARPVYKFSRFHHHVDYTSFKKANKLKRKRGVEIPTEPNDYGLELYDRGVVS